MAAAPRPERGAARPDLQHLAQPRRGRGRRALRADLDARRDPEPRRGDPHARTAREAGAVSSALNGNKRITRLYLGLTALYAPRSEEHTSEIQSLAYLVCR